MQFGSMRVGNKAFSKQQGRQALASLTKRCSALLPRHPVKPKRGCEQGMLSEQQPADAGQAGTELTSTSAQTPCH